MRGQRIAAASAALAAVLLAGCASGAPSAGRRPGSEPPHPTTTTGQPSTTTTRPTSAAPQTSAPTSVPPSTAGAGSLSLLTEPAAGLQPIYALMTSAQRTLDMTMYELTDPQAESILESDAKRGVVVRVLLDRRDEGATFNQAAFAALSANGVQVEWGPSGAIVHQKTITVDGTTSLIMTLNLTGRYYATDRDFALETTNPIDVGAIEQVFDADWAAGNATPGPGPSGTDLVWSPGASPTIVGLLNSATHSLLIENEEMDDTTVERALSAAAARGVDVEVTMTSTTTTLPALAQLASAGVHVRVYDKDASLYIHAKVIVADGSRAFVGSQNFSEASLDYNRELGLITTDQAVVSSLTATLSSDFAGGSPYPG